MLQFDKAEILEQISTEQIYELVNEFGGNPSWTDFGFISDTICHNPPGEGSHKLYYYFNENIQRGYFKCYTGCSESVFDIYQLVIKVQAIQNNKEIDLNQSIRWVANYFGIAGSILEFEEEVLPDWQILKNYDKIVETNENKSIVELKTYDSTILSRFNYNVIIKPWVKDNISTEIMRQTQIGYYSGGQVITIPHFDKDGKFVGLRSRALIQEEAEMFGKYRPIKIKSTLYSHPLGMNLYGLNWAKDNIKKLKKAIVFESEKSVLQYMTFMGFENSIAVACCGSTLSIYQVQLLREVGAEEIIIGFDKDFTEIGDSIFKKQTNNFIKIHNRYHHYIKISFYLTKAIRY